MRRRQFLGAFGATTVVWPFAALAQQSRTPVIGILNSGAAAPFAPMMAAFDQGLSEQGFETIIRNATRLKGHLKGWLFEHQIHIYPACTMSRCRGRR
jgi:hypothetical protein